ncbi:energy transducer TonB [Deefgea piscis]|uniref:energy transducer TonB n=1 Tax=Deefgea piscis TaxID=2739061 RepID=UPI001C7FA13C|nr:energy transducer TonB [Deefgea piscis]QZA82399.1 TonB family protein [Deefgea piscis]
MIWRIAFLSSLLLHALVVFAWQGRFETEAAASDLPLLVRLQAPAVLSPAVAKQPSVVHPNRPPLRQTITKKPLTPALPKPREHVAAPLAKPQASATSMGLQSPQTQTVNSAETSAVMSAAAEETAVQYRAAYLNNPEPEMPRLSRMKMESGKVQLQVKVNAAGEPIQVTVLSSSHYPRLDQAAVETVKTQWRFIPAKKNGVSIEANVVFAIEFNLK